MASRESLPPLALASFASVGYLALLVAGLGFASAITNQDVISVPGTSLIAAFVAAGIAIIAFGLFLLGPASRARPSYWSALSTALGTAAVYLLALGACVLVSGGDLDRTLAVLGDVIVGWVTPVVAIAAAVAAWGALAMRRTSASRPRWPWEDEE